MFLINLNAEIVACILSFRKSRHKPNLENTSKYGFSPDLGGKNGGVLSMRMQVILDSSFARPGSAPIWGGKKGEFRDWTNNSLNANEMEDLSTWICSSEEVNKVEQNLRLNLVKDARINKGDRKRLVEHLLCDTEMQNFRVCRKFSTLVQEAYNSNIAAYCKTWSGVEWSGFVKHGVDL